MRRAGVVQWQYRSFPSFGRGFDSHRPLQKSAKFPLIRLPLLTWHPLIYAHLTPVLRPFCAQVLRPRTPGKQVENIHLQTRVESQPDMKAGCETCHAEKIRTASKTSSPQNRAKLSS